MGKPKDRATLPQQAGGAQYSAELTEGIDVKWHNKDGKQAWRDGHSDKFCLQIPAPIDESDTFYHCLIELSPQV